MGIAYNASIVRDGLVLHLDAANVKTYSGSGTIWVDIAVAFQNSNMFGTVPYSVAEKSFDFSALAAGTASTSPLGFSFTASPITTTGNFTISVAIKQTVNTAQTGLFSNAGSANGYRFGPTNGGILWCRTNLV